VTSSLTGAAPTPALLIGARLLQGVAGGMLIRQSSGLIQQLFRDAERGRAFGILGATVGLATAAGPVIGGLILGAVGGADAGRWVFYVNVPIGLVALVLAARWVPRTASGHWRSVHLDVVGSLLLGGGGPITAQATQVTQRRPTGAGQSRHIGFLCCIPAIERGYNVREAGT
jgi:MFS family permease